MTIRCTAGGSNGCKIQLVPFNNSFTLNCRADGYTYLANGAGTLYFNASELIWNQSLAYKVGGGSWAAISDRSTKQDIAPYTLGLDAIKQLQPITYKYTKESNIDPAQDTHVGLIAQDVEPVFPRTIKKSKLQDKKEVLALDSSEITFALVNCVKELLLQVNEMRLRIEALESFT